MGLRAGLPTPKQFALINGYPLVMHTLRALHTAEILQRLLLVLPTTHVAHWKILCKQYDFPIAHRVVGGGNTRYHSAKNALKALTGEENGLVAIHDASRPFVSKTLLARCFKEAKSRGNAVPVVPLRDTIRERNHHGKTQAKNRAAYCIVQTPQVFTHATLKIAYAQPFSPRFTDDASAVEHIGQPIHCVEGETANTKITYPEDLIWASYCLGQRHKERNND